MFDYVRKHTKILMFMMFLLIIPAFVLVGVDGYQRFDDSSSAVARVGSRDITQAEWTLPTSPDSSASGHLRRHWM